MKRASEDDECWRSHLDLLLDVVMSSSEGLLDAKLGQLDVNDALVVQLLDMLLSKVAAVVGMLLLIYLNLFLPSRLVSCTEHSRAMSCHAVSGCMSCHAAAVSSQCPCCSSSFICCSECALVGTSAKEENVTFGLQQLRCFRHMQEPVGNTPDSAAAMV